MLTTEESEQNIISLHLSAPFLYERSKILYGKGKIEEAISYLKRAIHFEPTNHEMQCQLGMLLFELGQYYESNDVFEKILDVDDSYDDCYYFLANNYAYLGLFEQARTYAEQYMEKCDDEQLKREVEELIEIVNMEEEEGDFFPQDDLIVKQEEAAQCIRDAKFEQAIILLEELLMEYPKCWSAYNHMAIAFFQQGNYEAALDVLEDLLEKNPGNLYALCNQMLFYYSLGEDDKIASLLDELSQVYPLSSEQQVKLGISFAAVGENEIGYKWLHYLQKNGYMGDISYFYWLAYTAYQTGNDSMAKIAWRSVLELDRDYEGYEPWE